MSRRVLGTLTSSAFMLTAIKVAHTIVWGFFVACIVAVRIFAYAGGIIFTLARWVFAPS
jgi:hypothetical protein